MMKLSIRSLKNQELWKGSFSITLEYSGASNIDETQALSSFFEKLSDMLLRANDQIHQITLQAIADKARIREILSAPISQLALKTRTKTVLHNGGFITLADIVAIDISDYFKVSGVGSHILTEIETYVYNNGFTFGFPIETYSLVSQRKQ